MISTGAKLAGDSTADSRRLDKPTAPGLERGHRGAGRLARLAAALLLGALALACQGTPAPADKGEGSGPTPTRPLFADAFRPDANRIIEAARASDRAYTRLVELCDDIGPRLAGSRELDDALLWAASALKEDGHEGVRIEPVTVEKWVRGEESLTLLEPRVTKLDMIGLGNSIGTPPGGITAEVVVVKDRAALEALGDGARGKIVLFDFPMPPYDPATKETGYDAASEYRMDGGVWAAKAGAVAALVRSVTAHSLGAPHTGSMFYDDATPKIPMAAVSVEAAAQLARFAERGRRPLVRLDMGARSFGMVASGNVIAELRGSEKPDEIVVIGGHIDSWDVGQGAHDNAAGVVISMEALGLIRRLGLTPRRTIRVVLFTNEENGLAGAKQYADTHADEIANHVVAIESDSGGAPVVGIDVQMEDPEAQARLLPRIGQITPLLGPIGAADAAPGYAGADLYPLRKRGVPVLGLRHDMAHYFDFHHSAADTVDKIDPKALQQGAAAMAVTAWVLAQMPDRIYVNE